MKKILIAPVLGLSDDFDLVSASKDDVLTVVHDGVALDYLLFTKGFLDLVLHVFRGVLHENR